MIILDTDCLSLLNRENILNAARLQRRLDEFPAEELFTTIITFEEQMRGWLSVIAKCRTNEEQISAYARLHRFLESYRNTQVLDFDEAAAEVSRRLRADKVRIGKMDLRIASIAIANNAILISRNLSDFEQVPNLSVENWTV